MRRQLLILALMAAWSWSAIAAQRADANAIMQVANQFRNAIQEKDEQAFLGLFLHGDVTWQSAMSDALYERSKINKPSVTRVTHEPGRSPASFIQSIVRRAARDEERFRNIRIDTDGAVASVAFDFTFLRDHEVINSGREYWLLVKTDTGWKIASVVWSDS